MMNEIEKLVKRLRAAGHKLTVENNWIVVNPPSALADTLLIQKLNKGEKLAKYIKEHP